MKLFTTAIGARFGLFFACAGLALGAPPRVEKTINRDWTFEYFPSPTPEIAPAAPNYDDAHWPAVAVPHTWSTYETTRDLHPFIRNASERDDSYWWYGWGWYRKKIIVGQEHAARLVFLEFDGVQKYAKIYFNGVFVAEHKGGYTSFSVDVTKQVKFGEENVLAVQVSNRRDDPFGMIPPATAGNFDVYGGIYRDVRIVFTDRLHVPFQGSAEHEGGTFVTTPEISAAHATVRVRTWVQNDFAEKRDATLVTTVRDADGKTLLTATAHGPLAPGELREFTQDFEPLSQPHLWSPDSPYLYTVTTEVRDGADGIRLADTFVSPLGFRWFSWDDRDNRLVLNGKKILLRGMNRHQEFPWLGDAMPKWIHRSDLEDMRAHLGLNFQRTVHYPNDPFVYAECDRLGFLLIEESPNIKDIAFGRDVQRQQLREMIRRDRNHPSIIIWSMGNETNQPADSAWAVAEDTSRIIYLRRSDNGGDHVQLTDKNLPIENLLRCTVRGWLDGDDHDFGAEGPQPAGAQVTGTEEWQYEKNRTSDHLLTGNVVTWIYADHGADRHYLNSPLLHINPKGWTDAYRFPKLTYYLWEANFTSAPMVFIHPTWWRPQYVGKRHDIRVDSNCDEVELKLDGVSLGKKAPSPANEHSVVFENVEVRRGTLTAEGRRGPTRVSYVLAMSGPPERLVLTTAQKEIPADRSGIAILAADIVDEKGVHVFGANPPLTWEIAGPGALVGPPRYETDTHKKEAMDGTMYIDAPVANLVRSTTVPGEIRVRVSAPGLKPAEVVVHAVAPPNDFVEGLAEPPLADAGRVAVARDPKFKPVTFSARNQKIAEIEQDVDFQPGPDGYREQVERFVAAHNSGADPFSVPYRAFVERIVALVTERNGHLVADDYNFNVRAFNAGKKSK